MSLNTRHELFRCFRIWPFFLVLASGTPRDGVFRALAAAFLNSAARGMRWEARQGRNTGRISDFHIFATGDLTHTCANSDMLLRVSHISNFSLRLACSDQKLQKSIVLTKNLRTKKRSLMVWSRARQTLLQINSRTFVGFC